MLGGQRWLIKCAGSGGVDSFGFMSAFMHPLDDPAVASALSRSHLHGEKSSLISLLD